MTFRIADTFSDALGRLTAQEQKAVKTAFDLQMNPASPGLSLQRVDRACDKGFWTARVNGDIRLVLHKQGGIGGWLVRRVLAVSWSITAHRIRSGVAVTSCGPKPWLNLMEVTKTGWASHQVLREPGPGSANSPIGRMKSRHFGLGLAHFSLKASLRAIFWFWYAAHPWRRQLRQ
jgi:hypothetical protein